MKNKGILGYMLFMVLGIVVAWLYFNQTKIDIDIESYETQINILREEVDSLSAKNDSLQIEAVSLKGKLNEYDTKIKTLNTRIYVIKQETQVKLDAIDQFGDDELERFFAERYAADSIANGQQ